MGVYDGGAGVKRRGRYDVAGLEEAQWKPGSRARVLKNRLGVRRKVLRCHTRGDGPELRADGADVQCRDPEDVTDLRTTVSRGEPENPLLSSVWGRRTPSMPVDVHTVMQNISYRLAGSRK
jgi:hypothetical protein